MVPAGSDYSAADRSLRLLRKEKKEMAKLDGKRILACCANGAGSSLMMENAIKKNRMSPRRRVINILVHVFLAVLSAIWVLPIFWIVLTSFRAEKGAYTSTFLPQGYTLDNYIRASAETPDVLRSRS